MDGCGVRVDDLADPGVQRDCRGFIFLHFLIKAEESLLYGCALSIQLGAMGGFNVWFADYDRRMYGTAYQFSNQFFVGWVIVSLLWAVFALSAVTVYPLIEGRHLLWSWAKAALGKGAKESNVSGLIISAEWHSEWQ